MVKASRHYQSRSNGFRLFLQPGQPAWRLPQLGALGALTAHWSLPMAEPALVALPTGVGKTAVALAAPYLVTAKRVLVVVPSRELRRQIAQQFRSEADLSRIGALKRARTPVVLEAEGLVDDWASLDTADVVVALPNSISPAHYVGRLPPIDLFDLVVIDEAHHAPALTWRAILEHFTNAKVVLLTATPYRRDGQRLPGATIYHYPLRQALEDGIYQPAQAEILAPSSTTTRSPLDQQIAAEVVRLLGEAAHASSAALVRASSKSRAEELARIYDAEGLRVPVLHSGLGERRQRSIIDGLRDGTHRAVAVVGMLGEGFDLPSLRIVGYHDKHKSLPATAQLIGRLARADPRYPQPSVVVTVRDVDVYPELEGAVRSLYDEDADWAKVLPGIIDAQVADDLQNRAYAATFTAAPPSLAVEAIQPIRRSVVFEIPPGAALPASLVASPTPEELQPGRVVKGATVFYSHFDAAGQTLVVVTSSVSRPRWLNDSGLDSEAYDLLLVSFRASPRADLPSLVFVNADDDVIGREIRRLLGIEDLVRRADPGRLNEAFDSLQRISVSSVGVRTTLTGRGTPSYRMFAGSGVDRGLRDADTSFSSLGHAIVQAADQNGTFSAGVATGKAKYWEMRYTPLREYTQFVSWLAERYWFPTVSTAGQLLPQVTRGKRLMSWPTAKPLAAEFDYALIGTGWHTSSGIAFEALDLQAFPIGQRGVPDRLPLEISAPNAGGPTTIWRGHQDLSGAISPVGTDLVVQRGLGSTYLLSDVLADRPPSVFFTDGTTIRGSNHFDSRARSTSIPAGLLEPLDWPGVDITAETRASATRHNATRPTPLTSVHEALEGLLCNRPLMGRRRWILCNDGSGEFADYIVIEQGGNRVDVGLWHAKYAHGPAPSVRTPDLQEVIAQAIKSRRWITEVGFWKELGARLNGRSQPVARLVEGDGPLLKVLCGENARWSRVSYPERRPLVTGHIYVVQPGLSVRGLTADLAVPTQSAAQCRELLVALHDCVSRVATVQVFASP